MLRAARAAVEVRLPSRCAKLIGLERCEAFKQVGDRKGEAKAPKVGKGALRAATEISRCAKASQRGLALCGCSCRPQQRGGRGRSKKYAASSFGRMVPHAARPCGAPARPLRAGIHFDLFF